MAAIDGGRLADLFDRHAGALRFYANGFCDRPEDVVQDAFLAIARQAKVPDDPAAWLFRTVRNKAIDASRSDRRRRGRETSVASTEAAFTMDDDRIDAESVAKLVDALDPDTREVLIARLWGGLGFEAIARLQGCSVSTAHRRYQAALATLQARLEPPCPRPDLSKAPTTR